MNNQTDTAFEKCLQLAHSHYENFPVAKMVPKRLRKHVAAVYAFARTADDIADEHHDTVAEDDPARVAELEKFEAQLDLSDAERDPKWRWIFTACDATIGEFDIPKQLFKDLVSAFKQDVVKKRYADFGELLDYCRRSANPVGRLVLILHGLRDDVRFAQSDAICTALQLANFWQDMSVDKLKNRIYIPQSDWRGLSEADFFAESASQKTREVLKFQVERTRRLFDAGEPLPKSLPFPLSLEIRATLAGGRAILDKIASQDYDTLARRPHISTADKIKILLKSLV